MTEGALKLTQPSYIIPLNRRVVCYRRNGSSSRGLCAIDRVLEPGTLLPTDEICLMVYHRQEYVAFPFQINGVPFWILVGDLELTLKELKAIEKSWLKNSKKPKKMSISETCLFSRLHHRIKKLIRAAGMRPKKPLRVAAA
ncbi:MAG: hypothetical protein G01um101456_408 [Parcubacteria group bacterium Gr01-1014_56]|nr:MAG: hypothetical protein G01um101456_408 [Parcubacteria group bacterium Gr01-1014_56]